MAVERGQFSSRLGFILAAAGSAVGLGNLVAFPVMASKNGGAVFLIVYVLFVALICFPVLLAEIAMGRNTRRNPVGAFGALAGDRSPWRWAGKLAILTPFMIAVFYTPWSQCGSSSLCSAHLPVNLRPWQPPMRLAR